MSRALWGAVLLAVFAAAPVGSQPSGNATLDFEFE